MEYSRNKIKKAGKVLRNKEDFTPEKISFAEDALQYWRSLHEDVLNDFYSVVYTEVMAINTNAYVVQRLKRSPSIIAKLKRQENNQLTTMQDIVGIRAIMSNLTEVYRLREKLKKATNPHLFEKYDNYMTNPQKSGYRSIHLIYKYNSPKDPLKHNLLIEIQLRTELQHSWATAVETMGTFLGTNLKFGEGQPKWLKYFALTSSAFSFLEDTPQVPQHSHLSQNEVYKQVLYEFRYNEITKCLTGFASAAKHIIEKRIKNEYYYLVRLSIKENKVFIISYSKEEFSKANTKYSALEREYSNDSKTEVVLVSTDSIDELKSGFPNYFLDTSKFLSNMEKIRIGYSVLK